MAGRQITIDPNDTSHIQRPKNSEPVAPPSTYRITPREVEQRTAEQKRKVESGN